MILNINMLFYFPQKKNYKKMKKKTKNKNKFSK